MQCTIIWGGGRHLAYRALSRPTSILFYSFLTHSWFEHFFDISYYLHACFITHVSMDIGRTPILITKNCHKHRKKNCSGNKSST